MDSKNAVTSGTGSVKFMLSYGPIILTFKQHLKSLFFVVCLLFGESFDNNIPFCILLNAHLAVIVLIQQIA